MLLKILMAYEDSDIDGVEDAIDLCPNTSFDKLVDENGCPENEQYLGLLTLQIGNDISFDEVNSRTDNYNFFTTYQYNKWNISLSNSNQTSYDSNNNPSSSQGDIYLSSGYLFSNDFVQTRLTLGTKFSIANEEVGTGEDDYFSSLSFSHSISNKQTIFSHLSYSLNGDSNETNYKNTLSYSLGSGYMLNENWYSSLSYDYASSLYNDGDAYRAMSLFNSYGFLEDYFVSLNYTYGLDELSYRHTISLKLGITLE
jgi:hypothetical protein